MVLCCVDRPSHGDQPSGAVGGEGAGRGGGGDSTGGGGGDGAGVGDGTCGGGGGGAGAGSDQQQAVALLEGALARAQVVAAEVEEGGRD